MEKQAAFFPKILLLDTVLMILISDTSLMNQQAVPIERGVVFVERQRCSGDYGRQCPGHNVTMARTP
jgi:hypothetical protein